MKSGKLSLVIFVVQILNFIKLILGFITPDPPNSVHIMVVFILNTVFDCLALVLIGIYFKVYHSEGRAIQESSDVIHNSLVSSFSGGQLIIT